MAYDSPSTADDYLYTRYSNIAAKERVQFQLDCLHDLFQQFSTRELRVLDYGCGPVVQHSISAAAYASEIVFCDISSSCREEIQKWLRKDPDAFNWSPHFDYVVKNLEGKGEKEAREREELLRKKTNGVVFCDVLADNPMQPGFEGPYDVIIEVDCIQTACNKPTDYKVAIQNAFKLLRPGGIFTQRGVNFSVDEERAVYTVGDKEMNMLSVTASHATSVMEEVGFSNINVATCPRDPSNTASYNVMGMLGYYFVWGKK